jgi:quercetin dioxygenase-like cupin family protein
VTLEIRNAEEVKAEALGQLERKVLFAPSLGNSQYLRMAVVTGQPGARSVLHVHPGNETTYTWKGEVVIEINEQKYHLGPGDAIAIPPDSVHPVQVVGNEPWVSICFYCDECPALASYRAAGGKIRSEETCVVESGAIEPQPLGELCRRVLFTPSRDCVNFQRVALIEGCGGGQGAVHKHLGNECFFTLGGQVTQMIDGRPYTVDANCGMAVPPDVIHQPVVTAARGWLAVAAYCDECPALKQVKQGAS